MNTLNTNWKSKEEYLQFVQDWKVVYKALSGYIRGEKRDARIATSLRATSGKSSRFPGESDESLNERYSERSKVKAELDKAVGSFWDGSALANSLLAMRQEHKELAAEARKSDLVAKKLLC